MTDQAIGWRILSRVQVAESISVSVTTLWRMWNSGRFPPPIQLSAGRIGWCSTAVQRWKDEREAASRKRGG